ncbi:hypothetical protein [Pantoea sp. BAV 3049]|uniref:hypothetical protein n=1 Tax=Pantoea sp. BAV 3049 TaxID=2654188 RepID=UPI00131DC502|nr:hypothetical protein [Pantoea sp. BAV 3049]
MNFNEARQTMTDDACEVVSALSQAPALTLQAIAYITHQKEYATRFILEQMAIFEVVRCESGHWSLTEGFKASAR